MTHTEKMKDLHGRIGHLLAAVQKNEGRFSAIDKDLALGYMRELYELAIAIEPVMMPPVADKPTVEVIRQEVQHLQARLELNVPEMNIPASKPPASEQTPEIQPVIPDAPAHQKPKSPGAKQTTKEQAVKKTVSELFADHGASKKDTLNEKYKAQGKEIADRLKLTPIRDLKTYIGLNKRFAFINTLFGGDAARFDEVLSRVNEAKSYEEALDFTQQQVVTEFNWKEDEPAAAEFFTLVMRRFLN